ncbi:MAG: response regulator [Candidatus Omnitrophica bacterium]|nr:response regulator [Candidatus Omnitrophota bacterium]
MSIGKKQIYIVDDDESVRRALGIILGTFGFEVKAFSSAEEFFSGVLKSDPGFLILDIHMPGLNGWTMLQCLHRSGSQRPVIVISADKNGGLREKALETGARGFFQKPIDVQDLVDLINEVH